MLVVALSVVEVVVAAVGFVVVVVVVAVVAVFVNVLDVSDEMLLVLPLRLNGEVSSLATAPSGIAMFLPEPSVPDDDS